MPGMRRILGPFAGALQRRPLQRIIRRSVGEGDDGMPDMKLKLLPSVANSSSDPIAGVVWITISMALFAGLAVFSRQVMNAGLHPFEVVFLRTPRRGVLPRRSGAHSTLDGVGLRLFRRHDHPAPQPFGDGNRPAVRADLGDDGRADLCTRQAADCPPTSCFLPVSLLPALFVWRWPTARVLPALLGMGVCAVAGHVCVVRGYAAADASLAMTFEFSKLPFAVAIAYLAFGETIDARTWIGALIIFASALYITRREARLAATRLRRGDVGAGGTS
jgi:hypothetical protein